MHLFLWYRISSPLQFLTCASRHSVTVCLNAALQEQNLQNANKKCSKASQRRDVVGCVVMSKLLARGMQLSSSLTWGPALSRPHFRPRHANSCKYILHGLLCPVMQNGCVSPSRYRGELPLVLTQLSAPKSPGSNSSSQQGSTWRT